MTMRLAKLMAMLVAETAALRIPMLVAAGPPRGAADSSCLLQLAVEDVAWNASGAPKEVELAEDAKQQDGLGGDGERAAVEKERTAIEDLVAAALQKQEAAAVILTWITETPQLIGPGTDATLVTFTNAMLGGAAIQFGVPQPAEVAPSPLVTAAPASSRYLFYFLDTGYVKVVETEVTAAAGSLYIQGIQARYTSASVASPQTAAEAIQSGEQPALVGSETGMGYGIASVSIEANQPEVSVVGDPHVTNIARERFDIRADGEHKLVQIPHLVDPGRAPDLRADAVIEYLEAGSCDEAYMTSMAISGRWTEGPFRITRGSNTNTTLLINEEEPAEFFNRSHVQFVEVEPLSLKFKLQDVGFHVGKHFEGRYGNQKSYLNVRITGLKYHASVGGLLGRDSHEAAERPPAKCVPAPAAAGGGGSSLIGQGRSVPRTRGGSRIVAE